MRITRETLIRIAKETAQKRALGGPRAGGGLPDRFPAFRKPLPRQLHRYRHRPRPRRDSQKSAARYCLLTPEIHLDIVHNPRSEYEKPKELRIHPWLGPELYDPLPLYVTQHFFEFVQAGVRAEYDEPANMLARARRNAEHARQIWSGLQLSQETGPMRLLSYLKGVNHAANAIALLTGGPLAERRFQLQFPERAGAAGAPGLAAGLLGLLGGAQVDAATLSEFLPEWEKAFRRGGQPKQGPRKHRCTPIGILQTGVRGHAGRRVSRSLSSGRWCIPGHCLRQFFRQRTNQNGRPPVKHSGWLEMRFNERLEGLDHFLDTSRGNAGKYGCQPGVCTPYIGTPHPGQMPRLWITAQKLWITRADCGKVAQLFEI